VSKAGGDEGVAGTFLRRGVAATRRPASEFGLNRQRKAGLPDIVQIGGLGPGQRVVIERQNWVWRVGREVATISMLVGESETRRPVFSDNINRKVFEL
jgi:hypothetical protein